MQIDFKKNLQEKHVLFIASMYSLGELEILNQTVAREKTHLFILIF